MKNGLPRPKGLAVMFVLCHCEKMMMWEAINKRHCEETA